MACGSPVSPHHGYDQQSFGPFDGDSASQFLTGGVSVHVDLPITVTVHERTFRDRSFLQTLFHLPAVNSAFFHSLPTMIQKNDPAAVAGQFLDHSRRNGLRQDVRDLGHILSN
jgi:hypothetical protein